jgi:hypothetical protein
MDTKFQKNDCINMYLVQIIWEKLYNGLDGPFSLGAYLDYYSFSGQYLIYFQEL